MTAQQFACDKCGHKEHDAGEIRASGSGLSRIFDIQRHKFGTVSCRQCGYTELYKKDGSGIGNVLDLFVGG